MTRVLVVEDSPTQAQQLAIVLSDAGFETETAPDAERAMLRLNGGRVDVVLSDLHLPGDSGFELCRRIKANPALRRVPVVVCTSEADPFNVLRGLQAGADGFFTKDRDPVGIISTLRRVLARPPSAGTSAPTRVTFLNQWFVLNAGREQLLDVLVSAFEDVVHLNKQHQAGAVTLRELNRQLEERNLQLQRLADSERRAHEDLKRAESQLVQAEKLSALGQMVAGVAHEINNPLAFIINNMTVLKREAGGMEEILRLYQTADATLGQSLPELTERINELADKIDLPYTLANLNRLIERTEEGIKRIQQIVRNLRDFVRLDESELKEVDLNEGIISTINVIRSQANEHMVELRTELGSLPRITCYPAKLNQVVLNLVANAIDACLSGGEVVVRTRAAATGKGVDIEVTDNGSGMAPAVVEKIFDPFFTTKPLGKGTGLGLSISYGIVQTHGGRIDVDSTPGQGSTFTVHLPLLPPPAST
jgi:two-component system NtrC family sensor kinase